MEPESLAETMIDTTAGSLGAVDAVGAADLLLSALARRRATTIVIAPAGRQHAVTIDAGAAPLFTVESPFGDAVVARLALLADLDVADLDGRLGRLRVRFADAAVTTPASVVDVLVSTRATADGLFAELCRLPGADEAAGAGLPRVTGDGADRLGAYLLRGEIGRGGMGVVYRAEHVALEKPVAIKLLQPGAASNPALAAQFVLEARAACRARHPGIVDVTDFGTAPDGRAFYVMELVEGSTLAAELAGGALDVRRALSIAAGIAEALRAAGAQAVVHRDLKPANVFVLEGDRVKLGDFGVACIQDPSGRPHDALGGVIMGTVAYMSPEQATGLRTDARSDLYSLGCVLYEMLTGRIPFAGDTARSVVEQHVSAPPPALVGPDGPIPDVVQQLVHRALAKRPEERFQSADEMRAALDHAGRAVDRGGWRKWLPR